MRWTIGLLATSVLVAGAWLDGTQTDVATNASATKVETRADAVIANKPPIVLAPAQPPQEQPVEKDKAAELSSEDEALVRQLMKLRRQLGSPISGTLLETETDDFEQFLRRAVEAQPGGAAVVDHSQPPAELPAPNWSAIPKIPPAHGTQEPGVEIPSALRHAARLLNQHADGLEEELPARAARMRRLSKKLRTEAAEIFELGM